MSGRFLFAAMVSIVLTVNTVSPCTIFNASSGNWVLAGNTEDLGSTKSMVWFLPGTEDTYGTVFLGFEDYGKQGGMNDQGLFLDFNALRYAKMNPRADLLTLEGETDFFEWIMGRCATVEDVIQLLSQYNLDGWNNSQAMFADKTGASAVLGPDKNGKLFIARKEGDFQVSTNFSLANPKFGASRYPCPRYEIANAMLENMKELDIAYFRAILSAVHSEGGNPTSYANICDLTNGDLYIYNFHNFEEVAKFNLETELKKGEHSYKIPALFPRKTNAQLAFEQSQKRSLSAILNRTIEEEGVESAIRKFVELKNKYAGVSGQMDHLVFMLGLKGKVKEAIEIYRVFAKDHPEKAAVHKTLGGLYAKAGMTQEAIECYRNVLELNPNEAETRVILKQLESG